MHFADFFGWRHFWPTNSPEAWSPYASSTIYSSVGITFPKASAIRPSPSPSERGISMLLAGDRFYPAKDPCLSAKSRIPRRKKLQRKNVNEVRKSVVNFWRNDMGDRTSRRNVEMEDYVTEQEYKMKYHLEFFGNFVSLVCLWEYRKNGRPKRPYSEYADLFSTGDVTLSLGKVLEKVNVRTSMQFLSALPAYLEKRAGKINEAGSRVDGVYSTCNFKKCELTFQGDGSRAVVQVRRFVHRVLSILRLAETIRDQLRQNPIMINTSMDVFVPVGEIDGTPRKEWLAKRKEVGRNLDPKTAQVSWEYVRQFDPYRIFSDLPGHARDVSFEYFARSPGSDIWVHRDDLPKSTRRALESRPHPTIFRSRRKCGSNTNANA
jgi:hypothetical protein